MSGGPTRDSPDEDAMRATLVLLEWERTDSSYFMSHQIDMHKWPDFEWWRNEKQPGLRWTAWPLHLAYNRATDQLTEQQAQQQLKIECGQPP